VIQGGGFATQSEIFTDTTQFSVVPQDPTIQNEPGISNLRGTIAMAKLGNQPNSATNQFFFNLSDTNTFLDTTNGGFTVFGQVLDMTTVDRIETIPVNTSNPSPFGELPVTSDNRLVVVQSLAGQGNLTGVKYLDINQNGTQDAGEAGIANVSIYIDANNNGVLDAGEISTQTDANGRYLLQATPGSHIVRAELSSGAVQTGPVAPDSYTVAVAIGRVFSDLDFGEF
jgi:cyclophilin family peptidyl-prolyl cis-trans isomerase